MTQDAQKRAFIRARARWLRHHAERDVVTSFLEAKADYDFGHIMGSIAWMFFPGWVGTMGDYWDAPTMTRSMLASREL